MFSKAGTEIDVLNQKLPETFCILPWISQYVATTGQITPCCEFGDSLGSHPQTSLETIWAGEATRDLRRQFLNGEKPAACWKCFDRDAHEGTSLRQQSNRDFPDWIKTVAEADDRLSCAPKSPATLDLRFSNLCNFKCRSCWHGSSSKWFADGQAIGVTAGATAEIRSFANADEVETQLTPYLDGLEDIYFAGGEPSMMIEHYRLLQMLIKHKRTDVSIRYNLNMSMKQFQGQSLFDLWNQFDTIKIQASIDAIGKRGELMRHGFDWADYVDNIRELRARCPHIELSFGTTVSAFNILSLPELCEAVQQEFEMPPSAIGFHSLQEPGFYRTQILPRAMKKKASDKIESYINKLQQDQKLSADEIDLTSEGLKAVKDYMNAEDQQWFIPHFKQTTEQLDILREENSRDVFPELDELWSYRHTVWHRGGNRLRRLLKNFKAGTTSHHA